MGPLLPRGAAALALLSSLCPPRPAAALRVVAAPAASKPLPPTVEAHQGRRVASALWARSHGKAHGAHRRGRHNASRARGHSPDLELDERWNAPECDSTPTFYREHLRFDSVEVGPPVHTSEMIEEDMPMLDGKQWCDGAVKQATGDRRVALLLTGAAFRARNYSSGAKRDCTNASVPVQRKIAQSHARNIIEPIEALGMAVDVYLTVLPCSQQTAHALREVAHPDVANTSEALVDMYGASRVKGVIDFANRSGNMYSRMADALIGLENAMLARGQATYAYFIALRYDVALDLKFTELIPEHASEHHGLTFFTHGHDFMFGFPGEMWNCMRNFWDGCMRLTNSVSHKPNWTWRKSIGCMDIGPLHLAKWVQGFAYDWPLSMIEKAALWQGGRPKRKLTIKGASGFTADGREHRCHSKWFWPPTDTWDGTYMPYIFHVG